MRIFRILLAALCLYFLPFLPFYGDTAAYAAPPAAGETKEIRIVDDAGQTIHLPSPAKRIIPLYAALGESLLAMGLQDRIVARTASDDILPASLPAVGTHMRPNPELIAGLRPDLVVQLEGRSEAGMAAQSLIRLGIPVARFRIASFDELFSCIERLGVLCASEKEAAALVADMRKRLAAIRKNTETNGGNADSPAFRKPRIFFEVRYPNLLGAGVDSMLSDIISAAGGENCLAGHTGRMIRLNEEMLVSLNPEIYLVQQGPMNKNPPPVDKRPHFRSLDAVTKGFVFYVPESRFSRPGPQSILAAEDLADIVRQWQRRTADQSK